MLDTILNYTSCGKLIKNKLYFSEASFNGLFCFDVKTNKCEFIDFFKEESVVEYNLHKNCILYKEWLFFFPQRSKFIHAYNIRTKKQNTILVSEQESRKQIFNYETIQDGCYVYNIPIYMTLPLLRLDLDKQVLERDYRFTDWCMKHITDVKLLFGSRTAYKDGEIYIPILKTNMILRWNIQSGKGKIFETVKNLFGIANATDGFWVITMECGDIFHWSPENGVKKYTGLQEWQGIKPYNHVIQMKGFTVVIPTYANKLIIKMDSDNIFNIYDLSMDFRLKLKEDSSFYGFDANEDILCFFFSIGQGMLVLDIQNKKIEWKQLQLDIPEQIEKIETARKTERLQKQMYNGNAVWECNEWSLKNLVADISNNNLNKVKAETGFGRMIYNELYKNEY